jgi:tetratricopeptide (TPR) repeat protein
LLFPERPGNNTALNPKHFAEEDMPYLYTWSGRDKSGQPVIREIQADTSEQSKAILVAEGYTELELREDEIASVGRAGFRNDGGFLSKAITVTAEDRLKHRDNATPSDVPRIGIGTKLVWLFIITAFAALEIYQKHYLVLIVLAVGLFLCLAFFVCLALPSIYYKKLIEALDWYRWDEVLSLVGKLKTTGRFGIIKIPDSELTRYRAMAFVAKGRLQDGLAEYQKCEGRPDCPAWLYKQFVSSLYTIAKQYDKAIEYNRMAIQDKPMASAWWDLAYRYARYKRDAVKAREAMTEAEKGPVTDSAKPFCTRCRGVIAYLEGDFATAKSELETTIDVIEKRKWFPFKGAGLSISRAYLCCVFAKQGDLPAAKRNFDLAREYLEATKEDELIAECRGLIGNN